MKTIVEGGGEFVVTIYVETGVNQTGDGMCLNVLSEIWEHGIVRKSIGVGTFVKGVYIGMKD